MPFNLAVAFVFAALLPSGDVASGQPLPNPGEPFVISYDVGKCCGGTRRRRGLCCNDRWQAEDDAPTDVKVAGICCGDSYARYPKQLCCDGKVVENPNPTAINTGCCGGKPYDAFAHKCCGNTLTPFSGSQNLWCCGEAAYAPNDSSCCDGAVVPNAYGTAVCCSGRTIDPKSQLCCEGKVFARESPGSTCCGAAPMDGSREACCAAKTKYAANSASVCCGNTVVPTRGRCCGNAPYDPFRELCCDDTVHRIPGAWGLKLWFMYGCCQSSYFYRSEHKCCNNVIVPLLPFCRCTQSKSKVVFCCGTQTYNPNEQVCCADGVLDREKYNADCSSGCEDFEIF